MKTTAGQAGVAMPKECRRRATIGDNDQWVFPAPGDPSQPMSRHLARDWWDCTERVAGIARVAGRVWHSLRRKFATELKSASLKDLCVLGGWKDHNTILKCHQQPDAEAMRLALENRSMLWSVDGPV